MAAREEEANLRKLRNKPCVEVVGGWMCTPHILA